MSARVRWERVLGRRWRARHRGWQLWICVEPGTAELRVDVLRGRVQWSRWCRTELAAKRAGAGLARALAGG